MLIILRVASSLKISYFFKSVQIADGNILGYLLAFSVGVTFANLIGYYFINKIFIADSIYKTT